MRPKDKALRGPREPDPAAKQGEAPAAAAAPPDERPPSERDPREEER